MLIGVNRGRRNRGVENLHEFGGESWLGEISSVVGPDEKEPRETIKRSTIKKHPNVNWAKTEQRRLPRLKPEK